MSAATPREVFVLVRHGKPLSFVEKDFRSDLPGDEVRRYVLGEVVPLKKPSEEHYDSDQRRAMLGEMQKASDQFYWHAFRIRCHSFIEFAGFMNEFIKVCQDAERAGIDWTQSSVHTQEATLPLRDYQARYLGEKFGCIFGGTLARSPELRAAFVEGMEKG